MVEGLTTQRGLSGRQVIDLAIQALDRRASYARAVLADDAGDPVCADAAAQMTLDDALANLLRTLQGRAACEEKDLPRTKDGKPQFVAELRWKEARELLQILAGGIRDAYTPRLVPASQEAAHAA